MKVITLIQSMQAAIDALSIHSADTEVMLIPRGYGELTGAIDVGDPDVNDKVTVSLDVKPIKIDFDRIDKKLFDKPSSRDIWDQLTIANNKTLSPLRDPKLSWRSVIKEHLNSLQGDVKSYSGRTDREEYEIFIDQVAAPNSWQADQLTECYNKCQSDSDED